MTDPQRCPDCGRENPPGRTTCLHCNHPLRDESGVAGDGEAGSGGRSPGGAPGSAERPVYIRRRLIRSRPPRPRDAQQALQLWLVFGTICVLIVLWVAIDANRRRAEQPVEGSNPRQQEAANALYAELARDSNSVATHRQLADLLYDTANWSEAVVHYRAAIRRDSSLATAMVDLGVCYYNLSRPDLAEQMFQLALARDPHQPVALFNLGIVAEGRGEDEKALQFYHRALQSGPPDNLKQALSDRMTALMKRTGATAPPLPDGR
jgi:tetratricopeptide (TPR) repeat protein